MEQSRGKAPEPTHFFLKKAEKCFLEGNEQAARFFLDQVRSLGPMSAERWEACAKLNELMGRLQEALEDYARVLQEAPARGDLRLRRARILLELGRRDLAKGELQRALAAGLRVEELRNELGPLLKPLEPPPEPDPKEIDRAFYRSRGRRRAIERFLSLFRGRPGAYARQWCDRKEGKSGYFPVLQPLTPEVVEAHLEGRLTLGVYLLDSQARVYFGALDLDVGREAIERIKENPATAAEVAASLRKLMKAIADASAAWELPVVFERSGYKGVHAWYFFEDPVPAWAAKAVLSGLVEAVSPPPPEVHIEVFPKQVDLTKKGYGNLIKLPLGVHRVTGKRSVFLDSRGLPVVDGIRYLMEIPTIPAGKILAMAEQFGRARQAEVVPLPKRGKKVSRPLEERPAVNAPLRPDQSAKEAYARVLENCCLIRYLVRKAREFRHLSFDERKVVLGVLGHLPGGAGLVHHVISRCADYDPQITNHFISRMPRAPLGCKSIRRKLFYLDQGGCGCRLETHGKDYPTPCLHAFLKPGKQVPSLTHGGA